MLGIADHDGVALRVETCPSSSPTHLLVLCGINQLSGNHGGLEEDNFGRQVDPCAQGRRRTQHEKCPVPVATLDDLALLCSETRVMIGNSVLDGFLENEAETRGTLPQLVQKLESLSLDLLVVHFILV